LPMVMRPPATNQELPVISDSGKVAFRVDTQGLLNYGTKACTNLASGMRGAPHHTWAADPETSSAIPSG
jgi:hypothetical protein